MRSRHPRPSWTFPCLCLVLAAALAGGAARTATACGTETDCVVGDRRYRVALPAGDNAAASLRGAVIFVHGYRGTAEGAMGNAGLTALADKLDVAVVAAQAAGPEWNIPGVPSVDALRDVDELAYFEALAADMAARFGVPRSRILVAGFSSGGMMVWHLACQRGEAFLGFVPLSGTFWTPVPESCPAGPVNLIHYHGTEDGVVPLAGRPIKDARQGDVRKAIAMMAGLGDYRRVASRRARGLDCTSRRTEEGRLLELCLFPGGHTFKPAHIARAWRLFGGADQPPGQQ